jgi:hypothetical protein
MRNQTKPTAWPVVDPNAARQLHDLIDQFEATRTIDATEGPATALIRLSGAQPWNDSRSIWTWFAAWAQQARALGTPITAVKIAEFVQVWHEKFIPASGNVWLILFRANDQERSSIEHAAFDACFDLDPGLSIRADMELPVRAFHRYLSSRTGRSIAT